MALLDQDTFYNKINKVWEILKKDTKDFSIKNRNIPKRSKLPYEQKLLILDKIKRNKDKIGNKEYQNLINSQEIEKIDINIWKIKRLLDNIKPYAEINLTIKKNDFEKYQAKEFTNPENALYDFLKNPYIWENNFEKYYQEKYEYYKDKFFSPKNKDIDSPYRIKQLYTYKNLLDIYRYISNSGFAKLIVLKYIFDLNKSVWNDGENYKHNWYIKYLLWFHFAKDKKEFKKILFLFEQKKDFSLQSEFVLWTVTLFIVLLSIIFLSMYIWFLILLLLVIYFAIKSIYNQYYEELKIPNYIKIWIIIICGYFLIWSTISEIFFENSLLEFGADILRGGK